MPADRVLEANENAFVVLDTYPVTPGHSLVISRRHVADIFDLTATELGDGRQLVRSTRERIERTLQPTRYNIGVNIGRDAGQTLIHVHVHIITRYPGDSDDPTGGVRSVIASQARYVPGSVPRLKASDPRPEERFASPHRTF
jgi:diadenosine tetraphosphate (Ap4A) HIT family hydrolase